ncbi:MAG: hypothetical protein QW386_02730 [Candidatus Bathyarchaeia archaeon]
MNFNVQTTQTILSIFLTIAVIISVVIALIWIVKMAFPQPQQPKKKEAED